MKNALIIFIRKPEWGKVKTRLAAQIGNDAALLIYKKLLAHTKSVALAAACDVFVFATEELKDDDWKEFTVNDQQGNDLGQKMLHAFETVFNMGFGKAVIIGSDCPQLEASHIDEAFQNLEQHDVVIGPAKDGGYYLLGMRKLHAAIFQNKTWSTAVVYAQTIETFCALQLSHVALQTLQDVDEAKDVPAQWL